jgi:predicted small secreted protein
MKMLKSMLVLTLALSLVSFLVFGCEQDTAERIGERAGEATKQIEEGVKDAGEAIEQGAEKFKEGYRDAAKD